MLQERHIEALRGWSDLGRNLRAQDGHDHALAVSFAESFRGLIEAGRSLRNFECQQITKLADKSARILAPLGEPLKYDLGLHRILAGAREEAYSDWLQWAFSQMTVAELEMVLGLHGLADGGPPDERPRVRREVPVEHGHQGRGGRLDLLIEIGERTILVIEVKITTAEQADPGALKGYRQAIECKYRNRQRHFFLLVVSSNNATEGCFMVINYKEICLKMRKLAIGWLEAGRNLEASMLLALTAALEKNLLRLSVDPSSFTAHTKSHLECFVGEYLNG